MPTGLTGEEIHSGSWTIPGTNIPLPDLGVTETVAGLFGQGTNAQGGSDLRSGTSLPGGNLPTSTGTAFSTSNMSYTPGAGGGYYTYTSPNTSSGGGAPPPSNNNGGTPPNPYTTYINGTKLFDLMGEGKYDQWGNPIGGGGGGGGPTEADVNAIYDPAYQYLQTLEAQYKSQFGLDQANLEQSFGQVVPKIQAAETTQMGGLEEQRTKGQKQEKSQFDQARNRYNELKQGLLTRFGGASSTGEATQELLGRTTNQEMGQIQQNFGQLYQDIEKEKTNTKTFYANKLADLEKEKQLKLQELQQEYRNRLDDIGRRRGELDSNKAVARLQMLQEYAAQARQVQYDTQKMQQQLQLWAQMKDQALQVAEQYQAKSFTVPGIPGLVNSFNVTRGSAPATLESGMYNVDEDQLAQYGYFRDPYSGKLTRIYGDTTAAEKSYNPNTGEWE